MPCPATVILLIHNSSMDYVAFSDESGIGERFTSIASFSFRYDALQTVNSTLARLLQESSVSEFKWQKLKGAKYRFCALKFLDVVWDLISSADARVDVLVWDNQDTRHAVPGRDDSANFGRMFFHLHSHILRMRPRKVVWRLFPDEKVEIDWHTINQCLSAIGRRQHEDTLIAADAFFSDQHYSITEFRQVHSHDEPCCQIADFFAGLTIFSRRCYDSFVQWSSQSGPNLRLWPAPSLQLSNQHEDRFIVLSSFEAGCKTRKLGVSLNSKRCLHTPRPANPINFWHYEPQHKHDIAPRKSR